MMKTLFFTCLFLGFTHYVNAQKYFMLVGTYDSPKSEGIYVYDFDDKEGSATEFSHIKTSNPSFITVSKNNKFVYAVNENSKTNGKGGSVSCFSFDRKRGLLSFMNKQSSEGNSPCHITLDKREKWLAVSNYSTGNLTILPINKNGLIDSSQQVLQHEGKGFDTVRQKSPHVHASYFDDNNDYIYSTDLGLDKIFLYKFNAENGNVSTSKSNFKITKMGAGPRHIAFSKNDDYVYVLSEMLGEITVFNNDGNADLNVTQHISTLPEKFTGAAGSADIHISPDGKFLYASNRGASNTIAIFSVGKTDGKLKLVGHQSSLGIAPRNFNFDPSGNFLIVANQKSDEIVVFKRNLETGELKDTGNRIIIGKPVCIQWIKARE
jgi:6-phosphogluconolactonase